MSISTSNSIDLDEFDEFVRSLDVDERATFNEVTDALLGIVKKKNIQNSSLKKEVEAPNKTVHEALHEVGK